VTHWLLDMQVGGRIYRYAQQPLTVADTTGAEWTYAPGLGEVQLSAAASYRLGEASTDIEITSPEPWARMAAAGIPLDGGQAVLRMWREGTLLERARVMLRGVVSQPSYGAPGEPLAFTLLRNQREQAAIIPHPRQIVDLTTWTEPAAPAIGQAYPVVIGAPGHTEAATPIPCVPVPQVMWLDPRQEIEETFTGLPEMNWTCPILQLTEAPFSARVYETVGANPEKELLQNVQWHLQFDLSTGTNFVDHPILVIHSQWAGDDTDEIRIVYQYLVNTDYPDPRSTVAWIGGHAAQVRLEVVPPQGSEFAGQLAKNVSVVEDTDGLNQAVSTGPRYYPLPSSGYSQVGSPDDELYVGFRDDATYGGGLKYRGDRLLRGAGDVLDYMLSRHYSGQVDAARVAAAQAYLNQWKIDAWIEEPVNVWDWLESEVLPLLPVEMRESPDGVYPAIIRYDVTGSDSRGSLIGGENAVRDSVVSYTSSDVINEVIVKYRPVRDTWQGQRTVTAQAEQVSIDAPNTRLGTAFSTNQPGWYGAPDVRVLGNQRAALSQAKYGLKSKEIKAGALWDTASAILTATWILDRYALPRRRVRYRVLEDRWDVGDVLLLTDDEVSISEALAIVTDVTPETGGDYTLDLVLVES